jgi:hypothetical protein
MWHKYATTVGLAWALLCLASTAVFAQDSGRESLVSTGVVAVITALDAKTGLVTLKTEAGEVFELPKEWRWKVGDKVMCDRIEAGWSSRFETCRLWQVHEAGAASARREWPTSSK